MRKTDSIEVNGRSYEIVEMPRAFVIYTKGRGRYVGTVKSREQAEQLCKEDSRERHD